jgi:hypothetical protein
MESLRLRVKDVVMERRELIVRGAKSGKDRVTVLPQRSEMRLACTYRNCTFDSNRSGLRVRRACRYRMR